MFAAQVPVMIVCLAACLAIVVKWSEVPGAAPWAVSGFGLALILCFVVPAGQLLVQYWLIPSHNIAQNALVFTGLAILWSLLRAISYGFLLIAVLVGRSTSASPNPPSVSQP